MLDWNFLIGETAIASVLPTEYARFAIPVRDALGVFLAGLPESRQQQVLADQASLPAGSSVAERLARLAASCPVLHKLGQVLARDQHIAVELREQLQQLESLPPSIDELAVRQIVEAELGAPEVSGIQLEFPALAEASVAVVVAYRQGETRGVLKILKPGIEQRLDEELALAEHVGKHLDQRCEELGIPHLDYQETFELVRDKLKCEVRLDIEQANLARAADFYRSEPRVKIPGLLPHCTRRITAMERVDGVKVTDKRKFNDRQSRQLAGLVAEALVAQPVFATDASALFHCDPHAGNLYVTTDHRLAILDWSLTGTLTESERVAVVQIMLGAVTLRADAIVDVLNSLGERPAKQAELQGVVQKWLRRLRRGQLPGFDWLVGMLDDAVQKASVRMGTDLMLFRKSLHSIEGVVRDLGANGNQMDCILLTQFMKHLVAEWPLRWFVAPWGRAFATRLSNFDVARWMLEIPPTIFRFWMGNFKDYFLHEGLPATGNR